MIGTFMVSRYRSRADFERGVLESRDKSKNSFVAVGLTRVAEILCEPGVTDSLQESAIRVGDGSTPVATSDQALSGRNQAEVKVDEGYPTNRSVDSGHRIVLRATFGESEGNFEWRERGVFTAQDVLIDRSVSDLGRKAAGTIWVLEAHLDLPYSP